MENASNSSSSTVYLHPIVALTISDQWTRRKMNSNDPHPKIVGYLTGKQDGQKYEVNRASLLLLDKRTKENDFAASSFDEDFFKTQMDLSKEMYPDEELLGWFINGSHIKVSEMEEHLNQQFRKRIDRPLLLKLDTEHLQSTGKLNIGVFETVVDEADVNKVTYNLLPVQFETEASELIGLEHMASFSAAADYSHTSASKVLTSLAVSMEVFHHRLRVCREYIRDVINQEVPADPKILSDIFKLCLRLKALKSQTAAEDPNLVVTSKQILNIAGITALYEEITNTAELLNGLLGEQQQPAAQSSSSQQRRVPFGLH